MADRHVPGSRLSAFLDDELTESDAIEVAHHTAGCPRCTVELESLRATRDALRALPRLQAPVLSGVGRGLRRHRGRGRRLRLALVAASLPAAILLTAYLAGNAPGHVEPPTRILLIEHVGRGGGPPPVLRDVESSLTTQAPGDLRHEGSLVVVSFTPTGPSVQELDVVSGPDGRWFAGDGWAVGRQGDQGFLRSPDGLLSVRGMESVPGPSERLGRSYELAVGDSSRLDTGVATAVHVVERETGRLREVLHLDDETGLVVRRETYGRDGRVVRLVAYTELGVDVGPAGPLAGPDPPAVVARSRPVDPADLRAQGLPAADRLPGGYDLLAAFELRAHPDRPDAIVHLLYGDGLYTLSVFLQEGSPTAGASRAASGVRTPDGRRVWLWAGEQPQRAMWAGDGRTFTVLTDAPQDGLLDAVSGLPSDPAPSILARIIQGMSRMGHVVDLESGPDRSAR